jgi:hypothetical protein
MRHRNEIRVAQPAIEPGKLTKLLAGRLRFGLVFYQRRKRVGRRMPLKTVRIRPARAFLVTGSKRFSQVRLQVTEQ